MSSSKKEFCIISKILLDFISSLTEEQYNNLVKGEAEIKYIEKNIDTVKKQKYDKILYDLAVENLVEIKIQYIKSNEDLSNKSKLIDFCKYHKINYKTKETNDSIINNIIKFVDINKEDIVYRWQKKENIEESIENVAEELQKIMNIEEAKIYIKKSKIIDNKSNALKLAKQLNVFVNREHSYDDIVDSIVNSVVGAKIRSYSIRNKFDNVNKDCSDNKNNQL